MPLRGNPRRGQLIEVAERKRLGRRTDRLKAEPQRRRVGRHNGELQLGFIRDMVAAKDVRESFAKYDVTPVSGTSTEFASLIASELKKWRNAVPELGIKTD